MNEIDGVGDREIRSGQMVFCVSANFPAAVIRLAYL
jgi:hypothetical protein